MAGLVIGVAGATSDRQALVVAGLAGLSAGAMSMAVGEYVSVSAQRDSEKGMLAIEAAELAAMPEAELRELEGLLGEAGMSEQTAKAAARELTEHDALGTHARVELDIDPSHDRANPVTAALASLGAFIAGGLIPFLGRAVRAELRGRLGHRDRRRRCSGHHGLQLRSPGAGS